MFIKITKSGNHQYAQLVRSYRQNGMTKHKVILNLGRLDQIENNPSFQRLAIRLMQLSKAKDVARFDAISEARIVNWGYVVYKKLWRQFGMEEMLQGIAASGKTKFNLSDTCFLMVVQHLLEPGSKLKTYVRQQRYAKLPSVSLNGLYRSLDLLCRNKEIIERELFYKNRSLFNMAVDVVFYDVTTFSFESVKADSLRDFGFSKNGKVNEVQVVMGLLVDCEGRPIGYDLFPGNTFEGHTLDAALEKLEKRFNIRRVVIVADRGINSKMNLLSIAGRGYTYIVAARLRQMGEKVKGEIFSDGYKEAKDGQIRYKVIDHINRFKVDGKIHELPEKLIITYSEKRAKKDRADRERLIDKAKKLLEDKSRIKASNKRGGKRYLKEISQGVEWILDEEAIANDARFDGYYGLQTNETNLSVQEILDAYHALWKIEESFRIMKTTLEVGPIFHWTEPRIKGHFVMCFLAFLLERTLEFKLKSLREEGISPEKIREALNSLNFAELEMKGRKFYIKTKATPLARKILKMLKIKPPKTITPLEEFTP